MTVTRESRRMSRVTPLSTGRDKGRDVRRESRPPVPSRPYPARPMSVVASAGRPQIQSAQTLTKGAASEIGLGGAAR